jgi:hypothetical protein
MEKEQFGVADVSGKKLTLFEKGADQALGQHLEDQILQDVTCGCRNCMSHAAGRMEERLLTTSKPHVEVGISLFVAASVRLRQMSKEIAKEKNTLR